VVLASALPALLVFPQSPGGLGLPTRLFARLTSVGLPGVSGPFRRISSWERCCSSKAPPEGFRHSTLVPPSSPRGPYIPRLRMELHCQVRSRYDGHQSVDGRSAEEDVVGGIVLLLTEGGVELNVALGTHPLT